VFDDVRILLTELDKIYKDFFEEWKECSGTPFNLRKKLVIDIDNNIELKKYIFRYREFVNEKIISIMFLLNNINLEKSEVTYRVKAQNSIEFKIDSYIRTHESGKIPMNKCLNDMFGIRIVLNDDFEHNHIYDFINLYFPQCKCINSSKNEYIATHVYLQENNYSFPWELQIWSRENAQNNLDSHKKYKQEYTSWERKLQEKEVLE